MGFLHNLSFTAFVTLNKHMISKDFVKRYPQAIPSSNAINNFYTDPYMQRNLAAEISIYKMPL